MYIQIVDSDSLCVCASVEGMQITTPIRSGSPTHSRFLSGITEGTRRTKTGGLDWIIYGSVARIQPLCVYIENNDSVL